MTEKSKDQFDQIIESLNQINEAAKVNNTATRFEARENDSLLIVSKEIYLSMIRHTYRMDNMRHTYVINEFEIL